MVQQCGHHAGRTLLGPVRMSRASPGPCLHQAGTKSDGIRIEIV